MVNNLFELSSILDCYFLKQNRLDHIYFFKAASFSFILDWIKVYAKLIHIY